MSGPLTGYKIIELAGIGPGPFCGMMLADMGAEVIRVDRLGGNPFAAMGHNIMFRNRKSIAVDLKHPDGVATVLKLCEQADAIFEGYRPGVANKLGVGPEQCMARNPKLVYGQMTGWGQDGPLANTAGHDINYISLSGALHCIGRAGEKPVPPLNLVGDFGGGGMMLAFGMVCALLEAQKSGQGQVVDSSMVEGSAALMAMFYDMQKSGMHSDQRGSNVLDSGAPFYDVYTTADDKYISLGSIEPQFYTLLKEKAQLPPELANNMNQANWPAQKAVITDIIRSKTRDQWCEIMEGTDVCFAPVLDLAEAPQHPHNVARQSFLDINGFVQPAPTPKFSRTQAATPTAAAKPGTHTRQVLTEFGFTEAEIEQLFAAKAAQNL